MKKGKKRARSQDEVVDSRSEVNSHANITNGREDEKVEIISKIMPTFKATSENRRCLVLLLEHAFLESVKVGKDFELLNSDKHRGIAKKFNRDPASFRPDITHQCLLMLLDSPLNRAGLLQVFIHTSKNVLIRVNPHTRIPRTFYRFAGLMVQLLHKFSIHADQNGEKLLQVIKNPITNHIPLTCIKIGTSVRAKEKISARELAREFEACETPLMLVVGAMAHGSIQNDFMEREVCLSEYPLSAALTCSKLMTAFEEAWNIF